MTLSLFLRQALVSIVEVVEEEGHIGFVIFRKEVED